MRNRSNSLLLVYPAVAAVGAMLLANGRTASAAPVPLGVTGFNADTIVDAADDVHPFPYGFEYSSTGTPLSGIDNSAPTGYGDLYFQNGFYGDANGVPVNGVVTSLATNVDSGNTLFNLGYNGTSVNLSSYNTLRFLSLTSQTLALTTPGQFSTLEFLDTAQNHGSTFDVTLNFSNDTSDTYSDAITTGDWAFSLHPANTALEMPDVTQIADEGTYGGWNGAMYESDISLTPADQALTVDSVTFTATNLALGASSDIYAISGDVASAVPEPASMSLLALAGIALLGGRKRRLA